MIRDLEPYVQDKINDLSERLTELAHRCNLIRWWLTSFPAVDAVYAVEGEVLRLGGVWTRVTSEYCKVVAGIEIPLELEDLDFEENTPVTAQAGDTTPEAAGWRRG